MLCYVFFVKPNDISALANLGIHTSRGYVDDLKNWIYNKSK